jgi:hypothetical protein
MTSMVLTGENRKQAGVLGLGRRGAAPAGALVGPGHGAHAGAGGIEEIR